MVPKEKLASSGVVVKGPRERWVISRTVVLHVGPKEKWASSRVVVKGRIAYSSFTNYKVLAVERMAAQGPHSHILMMGGGGPSDFLGSEILAQSDFLGSMKYPEIFLGRKKNRGIFLGCGKRTKGFFWVCYKK